MTPASIEKKKLNKLSDALIIHFYISFKTSRKKHTNEYFCSVKTLFFWNALQCYLSAFPVFKDWPKAILNLTEDLTSPYPKHWQVFTLLFFTQVCHLLSTATSFLSNTKVTQAKVFHFLFKNNRALKICTLKVVWTINDVRAIKVCIRSKSKIQF